jgi:hypothetical protein
MGKYLYLLIPLFLLGCSNTSSLTETPPTTNNGSSVEEGYTTPEIAAEYGNAIENATKMQSFLYEDQSIITFEGEGNEYASYRVETHWLTDEYVEMVVINGGVDLLKYYRVKEEGIYLIEQLEDEGQSLTIEHLETLKPMTTYLASPLNVGTSFEGWTIEQTEAHYTTPYDSFNQVIVITKQEDNSKQRNYFVSGIGQIAAEFEITDEQGNIEVISSKIKSIE